MSSDRTAYVDFQQRASEFAVGDIVYPFHSGNTYLNGRVQAVHPAIGMVDVEWPHGDERVPVEELQITKSKDFAPPQVGHDNIPGGAATVSKPGGPVPNTSKKAKGKLPGGLADKKDLSDFNPKALNKGQKVEMEHTDDPETAQEIAMDHLTEDPNYYDKLEKMERQGSTRRIAEAYVKKALYWGARDRKYRASKRELDSGNFQCPKCHEASLMKAIYKRSEGRSDRLLGCPNCMFLIKRSDIIGHPEYTEPDGATIVVEEGVS